jgi:hypothetical protein
VIVQITVVAVLHPRQHLLLCGTVALELVRDDHLRNIPAALEQLEEEFLGRVRVPPTLHQNIEDMPILVHCPPQVVPFTIDCEKDFIQVPLVAGLGPSMPKLIPYAWPNLRHHFRIAS